MRVSCEVEVVYCLGLASGGASSKSSRSRASLCLGKKPFRRSSSTEGEGTGRQQREEVFLTVSTVKNVVGTKYKIKNNVQKIFSKFVGDGKATVKFKEPAHDLVISKADPAQLKELLRMLKLTPQEHRCTTLAPLQSAKMQDVEKPKSKLVVKSRGEYPVLKGFPPSLESVEAVGIALHRVESRLLQLKHLQSLDLSNNVIKALPDAFKDVKLVELKLAGNTIAELPDLLCSGELCQSLRLLDLSRNCLTRLPHKFSSFKTLVQLRLDCNALQVLPRTFGKMSSLKFLSISNNKLVVLPPSFPQLSLESLDLFGNPFSASGLVKRCSELSLPSLRELAGRVIKKHRIPYDPYTLPVVLCHYLDSAKKCLCGRPCFEAYLHYIANLDLHKVSATVIAIDTSGTTKVPVEAFLCNAKCLKNWKL